MPSYAASPIKNPDQPSQCDRNNNGDESRQEILTMYEKPSAGGKQAIPSGIELLRNPALNRGTGFTEAERDKYNLRGFLPPHVHTQEEQAVRVLTRLRRMTDPLEKFVALNALQEPDRTVFFHWLCD